MSAHKLKPQVLINLSVSIFMGVFAQLLMKYGMINLKKTAGYHKHIVSINIIKILFIIFTDKFVAAGIVLYLISMFFWIKVLSKIDLSVAYPFVSIGIIITVILAALTLGESVPLMRWFGIFITLCGVYVIVSSHKETPEK
jgi:multidrug transporter EmrE-like cation transporter